MTTVTTQPTFGTGEQANGRPTRLASPDQGFDSEATWRRGGSGDERIAILYENREWMEELFGELESRGLPYHAINIDDAAFLLDDLDDFPLVINRVSPSSYLRGHGSVIRMATGWLETLQRSGKRVINGAWIIRARDQQGSPTPIDTRSRPASAQDNRLQQSAAVSKLTKGDKTWLASIPSIPVWLKERRRLISTVCRSGSE